MNSKHVLLPVDLMRSPLDSLLCVREMAARGPVSVTLLYVLNLKIGPAGQQVFQELCSESEAALRKLSRYFFGEEQAARVVVRMGLPHEEIVEQARADGADLIVLSSPARRSWKRWLRAATAQKIIDSAPCPTLVLPRRQKNTSLQPLPPVESGERSVGHLLPAA